MKLSIKQVEKLLPAQIRMEYAWRDILEDALEHDSKAQTISCVDNPNDKTEFIAVYKLARVEKKR